MVSATVRAESTEVSAGVQHPVTPLRSVPDPAVRTES